jgi:hypothetical protein
VLLRMFTLLLGSMGLAALVASCAEPRASIGSGVSAPAAAAPAPGSDLVGTWRGSFTQVGAVLYTDDGDVVLQIKEDGTFVAGVTRSKAGSNNLAKPWTWTGTVVRSGNRLTLRSAQEAWVTFIRSGDTLYGVTEDPLVEATIMWNLKRDGTGR